MVKRVDALTPDQAVRMHAYADAWAEAQLRAGNTDRARFEAAARRLYEHAQLPWHGNVVWVSSPRVMTLAAAVTGFLLQLQHRRIFSLGVGDEDALAGLIRDAAGHAVTGLEIFALDREVCDVVDGAVEALVATSVRQEILACTTAPASALGDLLDGPVFDEVDAAMNAAGQRAAGPAAGLREMVLAATDARVGTAVCAAVEAAAPGLMDHPLEGALAGLISQALPIAIGGFWGPIYGGNADWFGHWGWYGSPLTGFLREVCGLELPGDLAGRHRAFEDAALSAGWWVPDEQFLFVSERPSEIHREPRAPGDDGSAANPRQPGWDSRLHRAQGHALAWPDGWGVYAVHGERIPAWVIDHPDTITVAHIEAQNDGAVRRAMLERYGPARYLADSGAAVIDAAPPDHAIADLRGARLLRRELPEGRKPIVYLERVNPAGGPGGAQERCLDPVDAAADDGEAGRFCHAALAWLQRNRH